MVQCKVINGGAAYDDRGSLKFFNDLDLSTLNIKRMYLVENNSACDTRAWHAHLQEAKYCMVLSGSAIVAAVPVVLGAVPGEYGLGAPDTLERFILTAAQPRLLYVAPGTAHGVRTLEPNTKIVFFSTSTLTESKHDDIRFPLVESFNPFKVEVR